MRSESDTARALKLIQAHGWNATAFQTLAPGYRYFFHGDDGLVAYRDTGRAWVVAGAPIAPEARVADVTHHFVAAAQNAGRRCCFFAVEPRLLRLVEDLRPIAIGEQPLWTPSTWPDLLKAHKSLREQLRRARAKGVTVRLLTDEDLASSSLRTALDALTTRWERLHEMAPMTFLVKVDPRTMLDHRRCFVAERAGQMVGYALVVPFRQGRGWFVEALVRDGDAPNGTVETMLDAVMRWAHTQDAEWVTLGLAPLSGEVSRPLRLARTTTRGLYDFEGLRAFKARLRPSQWDPLYLALPRGQWVTSAVYDVLSAFASDGLVRFALRSLVRGPRVVISGLVAVTVVWALVVAMLARQHPLAVVSLALPLAALVPLVFARRQRGVK